MGEVSRFQESLKRVRDKVEYTLQNVDPLTGAIASSRLLKDLQAEQARLREKHCPYSLLLVDVDIREINYSHGREMGDQLLRGCVEAIREVLAGNGRVYRYMGAEFIVSLPDIAEEEAEMLKDKMLNEVGKASSRIMGTAKATLSIDYAIMLLDPNAYIDELIKRCERSTFIFDFEIKPNEEKQEGDNKVMKSKAMLLVRPKKVSCSFAG